MLADVGRQRRRTRRMVDSNWFTFAVLGVALLLGGIVPEGWGWLFAAAMLVAYIAIGVRWRRVAKTFSWGPPSVSLQLLPFCLSAAIGLGDWAWGSLLAEPAATAAISAWTALGCLAFWRWLHSTACLVLAGIVLGVGALQLLLDVDSAASYGVAFLLWAALYWFRLGRRAA